MSLARFLLCEWPWGGGGDVYLLGHVIDKEGLGVVGICRELQLTKRRTWCSRLWLLQVVEWEWEWRGRPSSPGTLSLCQAELDISAVLLSKGFSVAL